MNTTERIAKYVLPTLFALVARITNEPTFTVNFKRDDTLIGTRTFLTMLNEALFTNTDSAIKRCLVLVGSAANGTNAKTNSTQAATFRAFFKNVASVRSDVRAIVGSDSHIASADGESLDSMMNAVKSSSAIDALDVENFLHRCLSTKTSADYRNAIVGNALLKAIEYVPQAKYRITIARAADAATQATKRIDNANAKLAEARAKNAEAKKSAKNAEAKKSAKKSAKK